MTADHLAEQPPSRTSRGGLAQRYRSLFVLGRGGMGTVEAALEIEREPAEANDASAYRRVVALKRLLPDATRDARRTEMFLREARLAAMLDHPNVVRAYDYGELDGELFFSMEYVEGQPLSRLLRALAQSEPTKPLEPELAAYVLAEVCRGLHAAHELADPSTGAPLNLVHRDVSPQNVMIGYDGRVRLLDFGVAKIETESQTKTGEVKGKTAYMSPEQAMGDRLDRRSDLFGIGAILFECLSLRRMWGDGTDMEVIRKLALEGPPTLEGDAPDQLANVYARLVARSAADRPATALEVATALDAFVGDAATAAADLRALLERHFGKLASEQRDRLSAALNSVAPAHAEQLRESVVPTRTSLSLRASAPSSATDRAAPERSPLPMLLGAGGLVVVLALASRLGTKHESTTPPEPATSTVSSSPPSPPPPASNIIVPDTPSAPTIVAEPATSAAPRATGHTSSSAPAKTRTFVPAPSASIAPRAVPSQKLPDLDEKPF